MRVRIFTYLFPSLHAVSFSELESALHDASRDPGLLVRLHAARGDAAKRYRIHRLGNEHISHGMHALNPVKVLILFLLD